MPQDSKTPRKKKDTPPAKSSGKKANTHNISVPNDEESILVTEEGLKNLKEELENLKTVKRKEVAARLKEAISYGDLSENSEYEEAKNDQAFVEGRIIELEKQIKHAQLITGKKANVVRIGSTVTIQEEGVSEKVTYTIVGATESDPNKQKISNESPVGKSLLGKKKGDMAPVEAPGGVFMYKILDLQ